MFSCCFYNVDVSDQIGSEAQHLQKNNILFNSEHLRSGYKLYCNRLFVSETSKNSWKIHFDISSNQYFQGTIAYHTLCNNILHIFHIFKILLIFYIFARFFQLGYAPYLNKKPLMKKILNGAKYISLFNIVQQSLYASVIKKIIKIFKQVSCQKIFIYSSCREFK